MRKKNHILIKMKQKKSQNQLFKRMWKGYIMNMKQRKKL